MTSSARHTEGMRMMNGLRETGLEITEDGKPGRPLVVLDLDELHGQSPETVTATAAAIERALPLTIGLLRTPLPPHLSPISAALTLTLTDVPGSELAYQVVTVPDIDGAIRTLDAAVARSPQAALACGQLLRQTVRLRTTAALAAEAATYSMLLGGSEFATWLAERGPARTTDQPAHDLVRSSRTDDHLTIVLDHPQRRNALSTRLREELLAAVQVAEADPSIESIEISGTGPAFCSGGDLDEFGRATDPVAAYLVRLDRAPWNVLDRIADRLVVRTHGACIGAGAEMAAFAGTVLAAPDTYFLFPEVRMGLVPGAGGTVSVPRRIGRWRAAWSMLTGEPLSAEAALRWGLVDRLTVNGD
ncbi:enoyl-CoA hydratase/isomerase family protein [Nocardia sp. KC 131]|uniref:enoyl-CoA hydratase/isomerase family protein n=1 Tax=Nocardia arseniciresistens TaxID=3392119 RepID=UPI00398E4956